MSKKIIVLLCTFFYINGAFAEPQKQLTPQETTIYNEIMKKYEQNKELSVDEINQFLVEKKVSIQELYETLNKKLFILNQIDKYLDALSNPTPYQYNYNNYYQVPYHLKGDMGTNLIVSAIASIIGFFLASPLIAAGFAIKSSANPSPTQKMISSSLLGTGAIIGSFAPVMTGIGLAQRGLSELRAIGSRVIGSLTEITVNKLSILSSGISERFTHTKQNAAIKREEILVEEKKITTFMNYLKSLYPELTTSQPTSP